MKYRIPRNYNETGRLFSMFRVRHAVQAAIWVVPLTLCWPYLTWLSFDNRLTLWVVVVAGPALMALLGIIDTVGIICRFHLKKRRYLQR